MVSATSTLDPSIQLFSQAADAGANQRVYLIKQGDKLAVGERAQKLSFSQVVAEANKVAKLRFFNGSLEEITSLHADLLKISRNRYSGFSGGIRKFLDILCQAIYGHSSYSEFRSTVSLIEELETFKGTFPEKLQRVINPESDSKEQEEIPFRIIPDNATGEFTATTVSREPLLNSNLMGDDAFKLFSCLAKWDTEQKEGAENVVSHVKKTLLLLRAISFLKKKDDGFFRNNRITNRLFQDTLSQLISLLNKVQKNPNAPLPAFYHATGKANTMESIMQILRESQIKQSRGYNRNEDTACVSIADEFAQFGFITIALDSDKIFKQNAVYYPSRGGKGDIWIGVLENISVTSETVPYIITDTANLQRVQRYVKEQRIDIPVIDRRVADIIQKVFENVDVYSILQPEHWKPLHSECTTVQSWVNSHNISRLPMRMSLWDEPSRGTIETDRGFLYVDARGSITTGDTRKVVEMQRSKPEKILYMGNQVFYQESEGEESQLIGQTLF